MEKGSIMLDTSAYSAFLRGSEQVKGLLQRVDEIYVNPIILGELLAGFLMGKSQKKNRAILEEFLASPRVKVVAVDEETSERYAVIFSYLRSRGTPIPTNDLWIAASAMQHGLRLVTVDHHFLKIPLIITESY